MEAATVPQIEEPQAPRVSWADFMRYFRQGWKQGEHVTLIGPTGAGKTTLAQAILPVRDFVVAFANKPRDRTMDNLVRDGYKLQEKFYPDLSDRIVLWPLPNDPHTVAEEHFAVFSSALRSIYRNGGWAIYIDEGTYVADYLKLKKIMELLWQQGRSIGITLIVGTQRPVNIPLYAYDQATHLFFWNDNDERNLQRIGGLGGIDARPIRKEVSRLEPHEVLYLNTRTGRRFRTRVEV